jgi:hypothetical protein
MRANGVRDRVMPNGVTDTACPPQTAAQAVTLGYTSLDGDGIDGKKTSSPDRRATPFNCKYISCNREQRWQGSHLRDPCL